LSALNVLVISHLFPRPEQPGIAPFIRRQVAELVARGVRITVVSPVPWVPPGTARLVPRGVAVGREVPSRWIIDGCDVFAPKFPKLPGRFDNGLFGPLYYLGIRGTARRLHRERRFDLVHGQMLVPDGFAAARIAAEFGVPSIATERGYLSVMANGTAGQRAAVRWALRSVDQPIFVSRSLQELALSLGPAKTTPEVVYTGLDHRQFSSLSKTSARARLGLPPEGRLIVHIGRNDPRKGVDELLTAFMSLARDYPTARLYFVGGGGADRALRERASAVGLGERVIITGSRPHAEIAAWLYSADVIAHPSRNHSEGLPNALVEAAACGCAIVASRVSGIPEIIAHDDEGLLVEPEQPAQLANAIRQVLDDSSLAAELGRNAQRSVRERFSWALHGDRMLDIYNRVTKREGITLRASR
jgi:glycosyltransferase involved in cell wall biosynthesis